MERDNKDVFYYIVHVHACIICIVRTLTACYRSNNTNSNTMATTSTNKSNTEGRKKGKKIKERRKEKKKEMNTQKKQKQKNKVVLIWPSWSAGP